MKQYTNPIHGPGIKAGFIRLFTALLSVSSIATSSQEKVRLCTVPMTLDHNRMLIDAEIQRKDGTWRKARLWVDTGNPEFLISEELARDLGMDLTEIKNVKPGQRLQSICIQPPAGFRVGGMPLKLDSVASKVLFEPRWLFYTMHIDGNLPSTVMMRYQVLFDYPRALITIAEPGLLEHLGERASADIHPKTGIVQIDATLDGDACSFALDNGASYSYVDAGALDKWSKLHPDWPFCTGAIGCANIWGWWPEEFQWPVIRVPEIRWGSVPLMGVGVAGLPRFFQNQSSVGEWYSQKTARPVAGFLGPNAYKAFRVEIDYANGAVYFEKGAESDPHDMDLVGLTLRPEEDGGYQVIGVALKDGKPSVEGAAPGDLLLQVGEIRVRGATMGTVVDALRGNPGDIRVLTLERKGERFTVKARVERFL